MRAEIIAVGTELLLGDIVNTNAQYLSKELAALGVDVYYQTVVGDNQKRLLDAYSIAFDRADMVITTGGLGPTEDDLTKETAAKYFGKPMVLDRESLELITSFFSRQSFKMTENNKKQAYIPEGGVILPNAKGTAPGCMLEENGKLMFMLPGPPAECIPMFEAAVLPVLKKRADKVLVSRTLRICGIGESALEDMLKDIIDVQTNPSIAPYAKFSEVSLRLTAAAPCAEEAEALIEPVADEIYRRLGDNIYGEGDYSLEAAVCELMLEKSLTLCCAESCTGGMLASRVVDFPGASEVLIEGFVTYSNEAKMKRLGVTEETLKEFGAVSRETAVEMARGAAEVSGASIGAAITGIAGPSGGSDEKPVGLVYIALWINGEAKLRELRLTGDRQRIRARTVVNALDFLRREIKAL